MLIKTRLNSSIRIDNSNSTLKVPAIYIEQHGILQSHLKYIIYNQKKSASWIRKSTQSIMLLMDFIESNKELIKDPQVLIENFFDALKHGTVMSDGADSSGLKWHPRTTQNSNELRGHIESFLTHLKKYNLTITCTLTNLAKNYTPEKAISFAAHQHKKNNSLMPHLSTAPTDNSIPYRYPQISKTSSLAKDDTPHFSDKLFMRFLSEGFAVNHGNSKELKWNLRDILITILQHYGGLRESEPFHLYIDDIIEDPTRPGVALVKLHHPSKGRAPRDYRVPNSQIANRSKYLRSEFGLLDRKTSRNKSYHAGWKELAFDNEKQGFCYVQWFPEIAGIFFLNLWRLYLATQYVEPPKNYLHPFAFTNQYGRPASLSKYLRAHHNAALKVGVTGGKSDGTHPHGHRHAYGYRMEKAGLSPLIIKKAMHHKSISSQQVYTQPTNREINEQLSKASLQLGAGNASSSALIGNQDKNHSINLDNYSYRSVDPHGIFLPLFTGFQES